MSTILFISAQPTAQSEFVKRSLERLNYRVLSCASPAEAIDQMRASDVDVVLVRAADQAEPMRELIAVLKDQFPSVPVLLVGPVPTLPEEVKEHVSSCADDLPEVLFSIERLLDQTRGRDRSVRGLGGRAGESEREQSRRQRRVTLARTRLARCFSELSRSSQ